MEQNIRSFEDLECWKMGREVRLKISDLAKKFPKEETYGLTQHLKKSARSITDNIAEGYGRYHYKENIQFCRISRGSAYETINQLIEATDENYITNKELSELRVLIDDFLRVLNGYIKYLNKQVHETIN